MSSIFYDHLVILEEIEEELKSLDISSEEKDELTRVVDELVHHRVMGCVLDKLPKEHHNEFLEEFSKSPHHHKHISYLNEKVKEDIEEIIKKEVQKLKAELKEEVLGKKAKAKK